MPGTCVPGPFTNTDSAMRTPLIAVALVSALAASLVTYTATRHVPPSAIAVAEAVAEGGPSATRPQASAVSTYPVAPTPWPGPGSDDFDPDREQAQTKAALEAMGQAFRSESADPAWAPQTERHLSKTMASDIMIASEIVPDQLDVSCRSSLCRVKARFVKYNDASDWGMMLVTAAGDRFSKAMPVVTPGPDGHAYLEMYAQRR